MSHETHRSLEKDGYRALVYTPSPAPGLALIQSRRGVLIRARFPDLVQAAVGLPDGLVLDGELLVWTEDRMSFEAVQLRAASGGRTAVRLTEELPAHVIVFDVLQVDVLQVDGQELLRNRMADGARSWRGWLGSTR